MERLIKPDDVTREYGTDFEKRVEDCAKQIMMILRSDDAAYCLKADTIFKINRTSLNEKNNAIVDFTAQCFRSNYWHVTTDVFGLYFSKIK